MQAYKRGGQGQLISVFATKFESGRLLSQGCLFPLCLRVSIAAAAAAAAAAGGGGWCLVGL